MILVGNAYVPSKTSLFVFLFSWLFDEYDSYYSHLCVGVATLVKGLHARLFLKSQRCYCFETSHTYWTLAIYMYIYIYIYIKREENKIFSKAWVCFQNSLALIILNQVSIVLLTFFSFCLILISVWQPHQMCPCISLMNLLDITTIL